MKFQVYLVLGTSLSCLSGLAFGQCVTVQDCAALGYTEASCDGGKGVKCPFGSGWFCAEDESTICAENGFKYSCSGTGYAGGAGSACGGKYTQCLCSSGYAWKNGNCVLSCSSSYQYTCTGTGYAGGAGSACGGKYTQCTCSSGYAWKNGSCQKSLNGAYGDLYYCNGAVVAVKASGMNFYVAMEDLGRMKWSRANSSCQNYLFCSSRKGTLPTLSQLQTMYKNKYSLNSLLSTNGGTNFSGGYYWSSTRVGIGHNAVNMFDGSVGSDSTNSNPGYVRPVLVDY